MKKLRFSMDSKRGNIGVGFPTDTVGGFGFSGLPEN
jgi:hypothetical protein